MNKRHKFNLFPNLSLTGGLILALLILIGSTVFLTAQSREAAKSVVTQQPKSQPTKAVALNSQPSKSQPTKSMAMSSQSPKSQPSKSTVLNSQQPDQQQTESAQMIIAKKAAAIKPLTDGSIRFAYLADIHIAEGGTAVEDIIQSVKDINNQKDIQFVILAGDITEFGSDEEIATAAKIFSQFNKPWFILSGNHDSKWSESGCNTFAKVFGYEFFNFVVDPIRGGYADSGNGGYADSGNGSYADSGNGRYADSGKGSYADSGKSGSADAGKRGEASSIRFIGCNSGPNMRMAPALVPRESILILDSVAKTIPSDQPVIFVNHYPLGDEMLNWFEVTDILKKMNTQLALCGHGHNNTVLDYQGLPGVMGRSNLRAGRPGPGYNIVTIKNGLIDFRERIIPVLKESGAPNESGTFNTTTPAATSDSAATSKSASTSQSASTSHSAATSKSASTSQSASTSHSAATSKSASTSQSASTSHAAATSQPANTSRPAADISAYTKTQFSEAKTQAPWFRLRMSGANPLAFNKMSKNVVETQLTFERKLIGKDILGLSYDSRVQMAAEQNATKQEATKLQATEQVATKQEASNLRATEQVATKKEAAEQIAAGQIASKQQAAEQKGRSVGNSGVKDSQSSEGSGIEDRNKIRELWSVQDNSDIGSAALFETDVVYYANTAGTIKAYDVKSNRLIWSYATGSKIFSSPALSEGRLVIGCTDNNIYCFDSKSGRELWRVKADKSVLASPAIYKGVVYIGASDGVFRAIDLKSGRLRWQFTGVESFVESKAWVDDSGVYFGSWGSKFYALDTKSGKLLWSWTNGKGRGLSPAAVWPVKAGGDVNSGRYTNSRPLSGHQGGVIYFVTPERMTHALDAKTGKELWRAKGGREAIGISPDASVVYIKTMQDTLIAYKTGIPAATDNNTPRMSSSRNAPQRQADAVLNPKSAPKGTNRESSLQQQKRETASSQKRESAAQLRLSTPPAPPQPLWKSHVGFGYEIAPSPITATQELIFVPTDKGSIFAVRASDGKAMWQYKFSIALINYVQVLPGNRLLVSSMDGKVAILQY